MPTSEEVWAAYLTIAQGLQPLEAPTAAPWAVRGRAITYLVNKLVIFWGRHRDTLIPFLTQLAIAALDALADQKTSIDVVNPPGPE